MGDRTRIEWTDATWNPATGCTKVSSGCDNCYAATLASRRLSEFYQARLPANNTASNRADPFSVRLWPERLLLPTKWRVSRRVFVNSMSDLFHKDIPEQYQREVFAVMLQADQHIYQVLTKRPSRAARFVARNQDLFINRVVPEHIWIGTSVESQDVAHRVDQLKEVPAIVRFLSCEPLLGPLSMDLAGIHWVIVGGESGAGFRHLDLDWVRSIRGQCEAASVAFFFKQVGGRTPKAGGRTLDGKTWDEYPSARLQGA